MQKNNISIVVSAPSGAGKSTLIERLLREEKVYDFSISTTTRARRGAEIDGKEYYFVSVDNFKKMIENGFFLEWALVHGNYYGTGKKEIDRITSAGKIPIFDVDIQGAKNLRLNLQNAVFIFIVPPSLTVLEQRLRQRKTDSEEQVALRLHNAVKEMREYRNFDYAVVNDSIDRAVEEIKSIITAESCRVGRIAKNLEFLVEENNDNPLG